MFYLVRKVEHQSSVMANLFFRLTKSRETSAFLILLEAPTSSRMNILLEFSLDMSGVAKFYAGKRLSFGGDLCTVRFIGEVQDTRGEWLGVEWDDPSRGKHDGSVKGVKYFQCMASLSYILEWQSLDQRLT